MKQETKEIPSLNGTEETVMRAIWEVRRGFVGDIVQHLSEPKPPYNTVVTAIRNLEKKGYVAHETFANANRYWPLIEQREYTGQAIGTLVKNYFGSSYRSLLSYFVEDSKVSREELEQALALIEDHDKQKGGER